MAELLVLLDVPFVDERRVFRRDFCCWRRVESEDPGVVPADIDNNRSKFDFRPSPPTLLLLLLLSPFSEEGRLAWSLAHGGWCDDVRDRVFDGLGGPTWGTAVKHRTPVAAHAMHAPGVEEWTSGDIHGALQAVLSRRQEHTVGPIKCRLDSTYFWYSAGQIAWDHWNMLD